MSASKTYLEMDKIRKADAALRAEQAKTFEPEKNESVPLCFFEVGRYTKGPFKGLFYSAQIFKEKGKPTTRKIISDGVDVYLAECAIGIAIHRRAYK
jgi:hypothetical protein